MSNEEGGTAEIGARLNRAGWQLVNVGDVNVDAQRNIAIREFLLNNLGLAGYRCSAIKSTLQSKINASA